MEDKAENINLVGDLPAKVETRGRKHFVPTKEQRNLVSIWAACGMPQEFMRAQIVNPQTGEPINKRTLEKAFRQELDAGMANANALVAQSLFKKAVGNGAQSVTAAIFWMKCRAGWKPVEGMELTGKDGQPIATAGELTPEQTGKIAARMIELGKDLQEKY